MQNTAFCQNFKILYYFEYYSSLAPLSPIVLFVIRTTVSHRPKIDLATALAGAGTIHGQSIDMTHTIADQRLSDKANSLLLTLYGQSILYAQLSNGIWSFLLPSTSPLRFREPPCLAHVTCGDDLLPHYHGRLAYPKDTPPNAATGGLPNNNLRQQLRNKKHPPRGVFTSAFLLEAARENQFLLSPGIQKTSSFPDGVSNIIITMKDVIYLIATNAQIERRLWNSFRKNCNSLSDSLSWSSWIFLQKLRFSVRQVCLLKLLLEHSSMVRLPERTSCSQTQGMAIRQRGGRRGGGIQMVSEEGKVTGIGGVKGGEEVG